MATGDARWALIVDTYERELLAKGKKYPVLTHTFWGQTKKECEGYYKAHMTTDVFFRDCTQKRRWEKIDCYSVANWKKLTP